MAWKRIKEALALILIGDGLISLFEPRRHTQLWTGGPRPYRQAMRRIERKPALAQTIGVALIGIGFLLATRQRP